MRTHSSEIIQDLLTEGFTRLTLSKLIGCSVAEISLAKTSNRELPSCIQDKLDELYLWTLIMRDSPGFSINPVPYYEIQMIVLEIEGAKYYTFIHHLFEAGLISADEMKKMSLKYSTLYDYNAFIAEFPVECTIHQRDSQELDIQLSPGLETLENNPDVDIIETRNAIEDILEEVL